MMTWLEKLKSEQKRTRLEKLMEQGVRAEVYYDRVVDVYRAELIPTRNTRWEETGLGATPQAALTDLEDDLQAMETE